MKTPVEKLEDANAVIAAQTQEIEALKAKILAMEEAAKKAEAEEEKEDEEEAEKAKKKAKAEDDEDDEDEEKDTAKALAEIKALRAFIQSPEFRASIVGGSKEGTPEGGGEPTKAMTQAEALAKYSSIDKNDSRARAAFRAEHAAILGL
jgi:hypothetical protein